MNAAKIMLAPIALTAAFALPAAPADAKGCIKGAIVGGVAGHYAGHHAVLGAVGGCIVGHHLAHEKAKQNAPAAQTEEAAPSGAPPQSGY